MWCCAAGRTQLSPAESTLKVRQRTASPPDGRFSSVLQPFLRHSQRLYKALLVFSSPWPTEPTLLLTALCLSLDPKGPFTL